MRFNDAITGAVLVVFAAAEISYTRTFPSLHGQAYGPNLFPTLIGIGLAGCGFILILRGLLARRRAAYSNPTNTTNNLINGSIGGWIDISNIVDSRHARINAVLAIAFLLIYIFLSDWIGFIPLSFITI